MTLYEPDREAVDRIKAAMGNAVSTSKMRQEVAVAAELRHALKMDLYEFRNCVWQSPRLVAAYEFASEHTQLETFNDIWSDFEKRGGFKAAHLTVPVIVMEKS